MDFHCGFNLHFPKYVSHGHSFLVAIVHVLCQLSKSLLSSYCAVMSAQLIPCLLDYILQNEGVQYNRKRRKLGYSLRQEQCLQPQLNCSPWAAETSKITGGSTKADAASEKSFCSGIPDGFIE